MEPTDAQCDDQVSRYQRNIARLGGIDHASPAIVGPSPYIGDEGSGASLVRWSQRPVIAYAGARDGMLHAFYVSGDTAWTAGGATLPAGVQAGQELWAYLPPTQLCGLATNIAMVDANVSAIDVFGDFPRDANGDGVFDLSTGSVERPDGIREWRTLLVAAAGEGGSELFVMDATNPLKPALLWHLSGADNHDGRFDVNNDGDFADATDLMTTGNPASYASTWFNWNDGSTSTAHIPTAYDTVAADVLNALKYGRYDYRNMYKTLGTAVGTIWSGRSFKTVAFMATSSADFSDSVTPLGFKGVEVFAIDLATGQKLWQWQNRYRRMSASGEIADNGIPGRPALVDVDADGSVDRVYVGDLEGHLWELSAADGRNLNYLAGSDGNKHSFPLFGTPPMTGGSAPDTIKSLFQPIGSTALAQQPLTSPIGVGRFTVVPTTPVDLRPYLKDRQSLAQGTMGVNWGIAPFEHGHVYVIPAVPETGTRLNPPLSITVDNDRRLRGVLLDDAKWDTELGVNERVFGMPKIVDNEMFVNTSVGTFTGDLTDNMYDQGFTYKVTAAAKTSLDSGQKRFGGVLMIGTDVIVTSDTSIVRKVGAGKPPGVDTKVRDRFTPTTNKSWEQRPDGALP
jgi:type IV pilus assembly protein PilY1